MHRRGLRLTDRGRAVIALTVVTVLVLTVWVVRASMGSTASGAGRTAPNHATAPATPRGTTSSATPSPSPSTPPLAYSLTDPTSIWVVVNKTRPLKPLAYAPPDLTSVGSGQFMRRAAAQGLLAMFAAARAQGIALRADSGYRSYSYQVSVHARVQRSLGAAEADIGSARPGYSEHQTGWAVDVGGDGCDIATCFGSTPAGRWVAANCWRWGFLIRYPTGAQAITGYEYEPWHIRYVGTQLSATLHAQGTPTLEQWFGLPAAPSYPS